MIAIDPILLACFYGRKHLLKNMPQKAIKAQDESSKLAAKAVSNHWIVTAFSSQEQILCMVNKSQEEPLQENKRQSWYAGIGLGISQCLTKCIWAFDFWEIDGVGGHSGSRKSTIIALIERFYGSVRGSVIIDRRDVKLYNLQNLRKRMALVSQEPTLFSGSIRQNITYGIVDDNIDESEVVQAAIAANAHDFITGPKDGYYTLCGDGSAALRRAETEDRCSQSYPKEPRHAGFWMRQQALWTPNRRRSCRTQSRS
ncbi:hypothetical protein MLD38_034754 [Melastoma candidum]|uniref:Uncharacterized protein n=1 Tax=Melastoma candidum TaxID=119954 RepID=A0ACB9MBK8_9MYRT|nr:hypothetical protein MLD38_034754 [Melastoma candidum]